MRSCLTYPKERDSTERVTDTALWILKFVFMMFLSGI
jgi:hypothetical protein